MFRTRAQHVLLTALNMKLVYLASVSVIIPLIVGLFTYNRIGKPGRQLTWLFGFWLASEIVGIMIAFAGYKNLIIYLIVSCGEMLMIANFFSLLYESRKARDIVLILALVGVLICLADYVRTGEALGFIPMTYESVFIVCMGIYAYYEMLKGGTSSSYQFLILTMMLLFAGSAIYFTMFQVMIYEEGLFRLFGLFHKALLVGCYLMFSVGLWRSRKPLPLIHERPNELVDDSVSV